MLLLVGCSSLNSTLYNSEKLTRDLVASGTHEYNQYFAQATNGLTAVQYSQALDQRTEVYDTVKQIGLELTLVDSMRLEYKTNSSVLPALQAALATLGQNSTNFSKLVSSFITKGK